MMSLMASVAVAGKLAETLATVSLGSLLAEMTDRTSVTRFPEPSYSIRSWSSYDRKSVSPDSDGWFANEDWNNFIRTEGRERVMVDASGPGAIVRVWCAGVNMSNGLVRVYLDGASKPAFSGEAFDIVGGKSLCAAPFSFVCAINENAPHQCGRNLMLPIPYAKSCKVTFEPRMTGCRFWYNVETRAYPDGTAVETLTPERLKSSASAVLKAGAELMLANPSVLSGNEYDSVIPPDESIEWGLKVRPQHAADAVCGIRLKVDESSVRTLGATGVLERLFVLIDCDGRQTVRMPVGAFFGTGPWSFSPFETRLVSLARDGRMENRMIMPFRESLTVKIANSSDNPIKIVDFDIETMPYEWVEGRSMRLTATYVKRRDIPTVRNGRDYDLTFDDIKGRGVLLGTMVFVNNPSTYKACPWWGEGDEKVWVDGERFPSVFGTGTEDYFNYAWSRPEPFAWPFCAQPSGSGNLSVGTSVNFRARALDAIPFARSLRFDMELWHWDKTCTVGYDSVSWRYLL